MSTGSCVCQSSSVSRIRSKNLISSSRLTFQYQFKFQALDLTYLLQWGRRCGLHRSLLYKTQLLLHYLHNNLQHQHQQNDVPVISVALSTHRPFEQSRGSNTPFFLSSRLSIPESFLEFGTTLPKPSTAFADSCLRAPNG